LTIGYNSNQPLVSIDKFTVNPGEVIVLTGESGIGKTTLLKTIAGLIEPISGTVLAPINRGDLGYIPQNLGLVRHATVMHNVMLGANAGHNKLWPKFFTLSLSFCLFFFIFINLTRLWLWHDLILYLSPLLTVLLFLILAFSFSLFSPPIAKDSALNAIDSLGISSYKYKIVRKLSGGERRRVATARTLAQNPKLILADEFLSELDEKTKEKVQFEVLNYISTTNSSIIIVEHDLIRAKEMSDRLFVISDGKLKELSPKKQLESVILNQEEE
tara:strand:- start:733 stop:1548 length:816 start_codon:yes stop_codon:yes gene_type:complete